MNTGTRGFVVLSAPRSGSSWFLDVLNRTTRATVHGELFIRRRKPRAERLMSARAAEYLDTNFRAHPLFCDPIPDRSGIRPIRTFRYLSRLYGSPGSIGFKLMYSNLLEFPEVWAFVAWHRLPVLHLVRRNHLDVYISLEVGRVTRTIHGLVGESEAPRVQIEPNTADLLRALRRSRRNIQIARMMLRVSGVPHLEIHYEDLVRDGTCLERACDFLQLMPDNPRPASRLRKLVTGSHAEVIRNYTEVRNALRGTGFEGLLR